MLAVTPHLIVSIDWKSIKDHTAFTNSEANKSFVAGLSQVLDLEKAEPLMSMTSSYSSYLCIISILIQSSICPT